MPFPGKSCRFAVLVSAAAVVPTFSTGQDTDPGPASIFVGGPAALDVTRALRGAMRKLRDPSCQQLLDDFTDRSGRPLRENLGASAPDAYLARLTLRDGEIPRGSRHCASPGAAAFTVDGAAVFVCGTSFRTQSPGHRENALIHEMLHTLGLRETPLSSAEITRRVAEHCGS